MTKKPAPFEYLATCRTCPGSVCVTKVILLALFLGLHALTAFAQPTNLFSDGYGDAPSPLDQYPGAGGGAWQSGWVLVKGTGINATTNVISDTPLNGGGNYLNWSVGGAAIASMNRRQFSRTDVLDITQPYVLEWDYRLDVVNSNGVPQYNVFNNKSDYISFDQNATTSATSGDIANKPSFWVKTQGAVTSGAPGLAPKFWSFFDSSLGSSAESAGLFVNSTNVPVVTNKTYHFKITMDPFNRRYEGQVSDGVNTFNTTTATGRKFMWRVGPAVSSTDFNNLTWLEMVSRQNLATTTNVHSLDNLVIYQVATNLWPVQVTQISPVKAETFHPAASNFVFSAKTVGPTNTLPATNTSLTINGLVVTVTNGLSFTGTDADTNRTMTYAGLQENKIYSGIIRVADQAGRLTTNDFFFDTFVTKWEVVTNETSTNVVVNPAVTNDPIVIEIENFNFDPAQTVCSPSLQTDTSRTDHYIQNWLYGGASGLDPSGATNVVDSYFARRGTVDVDYHPVDASVDTNFRTCMAGVSYRKGTSDDYGRQFLSVMGIDEYLAERMYTNVWFNYTHEWPTANYVVYLRGGARTSNYVYQVDRVTSDYTVGSQTTNNIGQFVVPALYRREILKYYPLSDSSGFTKILPLSGKDTLRLMVKSGNTSAALQDDSFLNYMLFLPVPDITINNSSKTGSDFSFSFDTITNVHYTVLYKNNVTDAAWSTNSAVIGTGGSVVVHDLTGGDTRFYQVRTP